MNIRTALAQISVHTSMMSLLVRLSCGSLCSVYLSKTRSISVLAYWNNLLELLNMISAISQSQRTLSSYAFFISPNLRFVNVTCMNNKKAQLTQGLRATRNSAVILRWRLFQDGRHRHLGYYRTRNSAIRSADPENPCLEPQMEWIGCTVCEIIAFKLYCDLETGVRGHSRSLKVAP